MKKVLCITDFQDVNEVIAFANKYFPRDDRVIESMRKINAILDGNKRWLCMIGVCDICGLEEIYFMPACIFENEISGVECSGCGNMSIYPKEEEVDDEI